MGMWTRPQADILIVNMTRCLQSLVSLILKYFFPVLWSAWLCHWDVHQDRWRQSLAWPACGNKALGRGMTSSKTSTWYRHKDLTLSRDYRNSSDSDEDVKRLMTDLKALNCAYLKSQFERKLTSFSKDQSLRHLYIAHEEKFQRVQISASGQQSRVTLHCYPLTSFLHCCPLRDFWQKAVLLLDVVWPQSD